MIEITEQEFGPDAAAGDSITVEHGGFEFIVRLRYSSGYALNVEAWFAGVPLDYHAAGRWDIERHEINTVTASLIAEAHEVARKELGRLVDRARSVLGN